MEHIDIVLTEMCRRVGATLDDISDRHEVDSKWFMRYSWSQEENADFQRWLVDYLYNNSPARRDLMNLPTKNKTHLNKFAKFFTFMYGWKLNL